MGYIMGKVEGQGESWHGHVTAVTVAPEYRRQQLAKKLMNLLEEISDKIDKAYFVHLFVRASNAPAIKMYEKVTALQLPILDYYMTAIRDACFCCYSAWVRNIQTGATLLFRRGRRVRYEESIIKRCREEINDPLKRPITPDGLEYD